MKGSTLFVIIALAIIAVAVVGYYQGWYSVFSENDDHKTKIDLTIDKEKFQEDKDKAKKKAEELESKAKEKAGELRESGKKSDSNP
jgi:hypothetical protein